MFLRKLCYQVLIITALFYNLIKGTKFHRTNTTCAVIEATSLGTVTTDTVRLIMILFPGGIILRGSREPPGEVRSPCTEHSRYDNLVCFTNPSFITFALIIEKT